MDSENDALRQKILSIGIAANVIGFFLTLVACCSISTNFDTLMRTAFSSGTAESSNSTIDGVKIAIGLRAAALDTPHQGQVVWSFDEFCGLEGLDQYSLWEDCQACADVSSGLVISVIISLITYMPTVFTDITRMYSNYDVNCQKVFASFVACFNMLMSLYTWVGYTNSCFASFYEGEIPYDRQQNVLSPDEASQAFISFDFKWRPGPGLFCIAAATVLKAVDILCHCIIPTPKITRDLKEQQEYENL